MREESDREKKGESERVKERDRKMEHSKLVSILMAKVCRKRS